MPVRDGDEPGTARSLTIAIAMTTFNGGRHLAEQLGGFLAQTRLPDEIVIADDGSTDDSIDQLEAWMSEARAAGILVSILRDGHLGVTANFEKAIAATRCDIVVLSDQDDRWLPSRLAAVEAAFVRDPALLLQHEDAGLIDDHGDALPTGLLDSLSVRPDDVARIDAGAAFPLYLRRNLATGATMSFRRALFERVRPFPRSWVHDEWLAIAAAAVESIDLVRTRNIEYRQHGSNQIGVRAPTLAYRIGRVFVNDPDRNRTLATKFDALSHRILQWPDVPADYRRAARGKAEFEARRSRLPVARVLRVPTVLLLLARGDYAKFASQRNLDVVRDVLQPRRAARTAGRVLRGSGEGAG